MRLHEDVELHEDFLVRKMGFDPELPDEVDKAYRIMLWKQIITEKPSSSTPNEIGANPDKYSYWPQICLMIANEDAKEY